MEFGDLWKIGVGTILSLFVLVALFRFKRALRQRLFPSQESKPRGEAMAELLMLSARLQDQADDPSTGEAEAEVKDRGR